MGIGIRPPPLCASVFHLKMTVAVKCYLCSAWTHGLCMTSPPAKLPKSKASPAVAEPGPVGMENWELGNCPICSCPARVRQGDVWPSYFSNPAVNMCPSCDLLIDFTFLCSLLVILIFKMAPCLVLKGCLVFPGARRLCHALQKKYRY